MRLRDMHGKSTKEINENIHFATEEEDKHELFNNEKTYTLLEEAIGELNAEQKQCVTLFYLQKKSYQQITSHTGYSLLQVKSYIQNGKRNLKLLLEKKMKESGLSKK